MMELTPLVNNPMRVRVNADDPQNGSSRTKMFAVGLAIVGMIGVAMAHTTTVVSPKQAALQPQIKSNVVVANENGQSFKCPLTAGEVIQLHVQQDDSLVNVCDVGSIHNRCARSAWAGAPNPSVTGASQFKVHAAADIYANKPCAFRFESVSQAGWYLGYIHVYNGVYQKGCPNAKFDYRVIQGASGNGISLMMYGHAIGHGDSLIGFITDAAQRGYLQKCRDVNKWIEGSVSKAALPANDRKRYSFTVVRVSAQSKSCPSGQYLASQQCQPCPAGYACANNVKTICPAGKFQAQPSQATCTVAACGKFVPAPGATQEETCRAGTWSGPGATSCTPVAKGEYSGPGACVAKKCPEGEYQDCEGQTKCNPAPCGHFVSGTGGSAYTPCPAGTYQPKTGQKSCIDTVPGQYAGKAHCQPRSCMPGTFQDSKAQPSCKEATCGHYVGTAGSNVQTKCGKGFYQPDKGQPACIPIPAGYIAIKNGCDIQCCPPGTYRNANFQCSKAPCGSYTPDKCAMKALPCPDGEYTQTDGQSACLKSPAGSVPNANKCGTKPCPLGEYQDLVGQTTCKPTKCGEIAPSTGMSLPEKCPVGTFQANTKQTKCDDCPAGSANGKTGRCVCPKCQPSTFQPNTGQTSCKDSPCGSYVSGTGATGASSCPPGQYQDKPKQTSCVAAPAGQYAVGGTCQPGTCRPGTFTPSAGLTKCTDAPCGKIVPSAGQTGATDCPAGQYQPLVAQTKCLDAPTGSFTSGAGKCAEELCKPGSYQPQTGQTSCKQAACGHYVAITGSASQNPCGPGRYQKSMGQTKCDPASVGHFVSGNAACKQDRCPTGTYSDCAGQSKCIQAPCGYFVGSTGQTKTTPCPAGTFQDTPGQPSCKTNPAGTFSQTGFCHAQQCDPGHFQNAVGQSTCKAANCGRYVPGEGEISETQCPSGSYQPAKGQVGCLPATYGSAPNPGTCEKGTVAGGIFYAGPTTMIWSAAKTWCESNGDRLAVVKNGNENAEVVRVCGNGGKVCWIGGSDLAKEGTWMWVDKTPMKGGYTNWSPGEPNGGTTENCLMTWDQGRGWNDGGCNGKQDFVCERRVGHQEEVLVKSKGNGYNNMPLYMTWFGGTVRGHPLSAVGSEAAPKSQYIWIKRMEPAGTGYFTLTSKDLGLSIAVSSCITGHNVGLVQKGNSAHGVAATDYVFWKLDAGSRLVAMNKCHNVIFMVKARWHSSWLVMALVSPTPSEEFTIIPVGGQAMAMDAVSDN